MGQFRRNGRRYQESVQVQSIHRVHLQGCQHHRYQFATTARRKPESYGRGLPSLTARINHSCEPNCIVRNDVSRAYTPTSTPAPLFGSFSIHSIRPIATGEEIAIEYSDSADSVDLRQSFFQDSFFFKCSCARCSPSLPHGVQEGDNNAAMSLAATMSQVGGGPDPRLGYESPILSYRAA